VIDLMQAWQAAEAENQDKFTCAGREWVRERKCAAASRPTQWSPSDARVVRG
jgi:hypothetical protein